MDKSHITTLQDDYEMRKKRALLFFEWALDCERERFKLKLINNEIVRVHDLAAGTYKDVNVAGDSITAMIYDIYRQAGDWIM